MEAVATDQEAVWEEEWAVTLEVEWAEAWEAAEWEIPTTLPFKHNQKSILISSRQKSRSHEKFGL